MPSWHQRTELITPSTKHPFVSFISISTSFSFAVNIFISFKLRELKSLKNDPLHYILNVNFGNLYIIFTVTILVDIKVRMNNQER